MKQIVLAVITLAQAAAGEATLAEPSRHEAARHLDLQLLDNREIPDDRIDGLSVKEISGLAWDEDEGVLYAVSDKGRVVHLRLIMDGSRIAELTPIRAYPLADELGAPLPKIDANSEAVSVINGSNGVLGDSELLIVTERKPEIARYRTDGRRISAFDLPEALTSAAGLENGLESVELHPELGVISAPAKPTKQDKDTGHAIISASGKLLLLPRHPKGLGKIKALEVLPDGKIIVMERMRLGKDGPRFTTLRLVDPTSCNAQIVCSVVELATGTMSLPDANFEGLTRLPNGLWAVVSDDRIANQRRTLFSVFRLTLGGIETD